MKKGFGSIHYCAHFLDRVLSKSAHSSSDGVAAFHIASHLLKELDALQEKNPLVTLSFATDSLRVYPHFSRIVFKLLHNKSFNFRSFQSPDFAAARLAELTQMLGRNHTAFRVAPLFTK